MGQEDSQPVPIPTLSYVDKPEARLGTPVSCREMKDRERMGMLMAQQIMEQLYLHIVEREIDLDETLIIDIIQDSGINFDHFTGNA